ncbi:MAG TPA: hypothetical protein VHG72_12935 [Polyangia bacterium]|nr:hypothetical protein [Polyangia bacterium]
MPLVLAAAFTTACYGSGAAPYNGGSTSKPDGDVMSGAGGSSNEGTGGNTLTGTGGANSSGTGGQISSGTGGRISSGTGGQSPSATGGQTSSGTGGVPTGGMTGTGVGGMVGGGSGGVPSGGTGGTDSSGGWGTPVAGGPSGSGVSATVTITPGSSVGTVGSDFVGFSYEKTHITNDSLTSSNTKLVALYKLLGTPGMRIGANDVDVSTWVGAGAPPAQPSGQPFTHSITTGMVDELCSFLAATGVKVIYGVNFHSDNVSASAAEAAYVMSKCGASIDGFEIGNEIDKYGSWSSLQSQWESFGTAIIATAGANLIGPATTGGASSSFATPFAASESAKFGDRLVLLTQHYYAGSAGSTSATAATLQTVKSDIPTITSTMNTAAVKGKVPKGYRFGECNTFSGHGQMGVSDTLIAGLWMLDLMFENAEHGSSGVNIHGGETGMDGTKPFYYEPIMENQGAVVQVQPVYYAMLLFAQAGQGSVVSTSVSTSNPNFTAYAIKASGFTSVVLDNKNASQGVSATINLGSAVQSASAIYLEGSPAGSLSASATAVTLAGAQVTADGVWNRNPPFVQAISGNSVSVYVPPASAALVRVSQ